MTLGQSHATASKGAAAAKAAAQSKAPPELHHLAPPELPRGDFRALLAESGGDYAAARRLQRRRGASQQQREVLARERDFADGHLGRLFDETVRLSGISGNPVINTPLEKMAEVMESAERDKADKERRWREREERATRFKTFNSKSARRPAGAAPAESSDAESDEGGGDGAVHPDDDVEEGKYTGNLAEDVKIATRRSWINGELLIPQKSMTQIPEYLASTVGLQLPPPKKISMPRNCLSGYFSSKVAQYSCKHLGYLEELDLASNMIVTLPPDIGHLQLLKRLNLERNRLQTLPDGLLDCRSLKVLKLNKNNFKELPKFIGNLSELEHLDVSDNILSILPCTLPRLRRLRFLDVSSNGLAHLAIQPILQEYEDRLKQEANRAKQRVSSLTGVWDTVIDRHTGQTCYYNRMTGLATNTKPIQVELGKEADVGKMPERLDRLISFQMEKANYIERKKMLAVAGKFEWDLAMDASTGRIYYKNNVSGETLWELPAVLDTLGGLVGLVHFKANQNLIRSLPPSITRCTNLEILEVKNNYLGSLPVDIGKLTKVKILKLNQNEISRLPDSMEHCTALSELQMTGNYVDRFPDFINKCANLRKLLLGNNFLKMLPYALGFLTNLVELQLFNNPLVDPPYDTVMEGLEKTLYFCRQKYWARVNGPTPVMQIHASGIGDECLELQPEFRDRLAKMIKLAQANLSLELQLLNLKEMPQDVFKLEGLKSADLSRNDFGVKILEIRENFGSLNAFFLKSCRIRVLSPDFMHLKNVVELNLEDNNLEYLPPQLCRIRRMQFLNLTKNKLYNLPDNFGDMTELREVLLDNNRLETFPPSIRNLRHLEVLRANRNWLYQLPDDIHELKALSDLSLDGNFITYLPETIGQLNLKTLKLAHNRLEFLSEDILRPNLKNKEQSAGRVPSSTLVKTLPILTGCKTTEHLLSFFPYYAIKSKSVICYQSTLYNSYVYAPLG